jgi:hypothetical protein
MADLKITIPDDTYATMAKHPEIRWEVIVVNALRDETTKVKMVDNLVLQDNKIQVAVAENLEHAFDCEFMKFYNSLY